MIAPILTPDRQQGAEQCARQHGWDESRPEDVLEMPSMFIGSVEQIAEQM